MSAADVETVRAKLRLIAQHAQEDAYRPTGALWDFRTCAEHIGGQLAMIKQLALIVESLLPQEEPEHDPVPYTDYLPELIGLLDQPAVAYDAEDPNAPGGEDR